MATPRYLTKSRFKQALECPTKLYYTGKPEYLNTALDDSFLAALAEGGYQVGALACLMYPGGVEVDDIGHAAQLARTQALLARENVTIYEAAFAHDGLFVRVDVLRKTGNSVELIEVKAKSYDPGEVRGLRGARGAISPGYLPYLQDVAFQRFVAGLQCPQFEFRAFLLLADKSATATVDGLNQLFPIHRGGGRTTVTRPVDGVDLGAPLLAAVPVDIEVQEILSGTLDVVGVEMAFADAVAHLASAYQSDQRLGPVPSKACGNCEFKAENLPGAGEPRSGFHECWRQALGWEDRDFDSPTVLDLWKFTKKRELIQQGKLKLEQLVPADVGFDSSEPGTGGMTPKHRQWYQCSGTWPGGGDFYFDATGMAAAMRKWRYPYHFIDFETSAVAIPFRRGQRPYETVAFQFSHHVMRAGGRVEHLHQCLEVDPGVDPTLPFLRQLKAALSADSGTIFRWATHENTVLNQLRARLLDEADPAPDRDELVAFIESITTRKVDGVEIAGPRSMVDLCKLAELHYFHPSTKGSSSLKKVLPALMQSSDFLRDLYGQPVYGTTAMPSQNHEEPMVWWRSVNGLVADPYDLLPPVFGHLSSLELAALEAGADQSLQAGGAAMAAYARLQFEQIEQIERGALKDALLRYCELDTLAMVMTVQAWRGFQKGN
ncbi:DUF2779 domain-containing protein [Rubrivivax sp. A210]|uniref:DUF2779 domain-containing protein n=1 Tax=Rubrivivax sp. A210 TaxID=2772301 RepID=UPI00191B67AE|nr:DUF2779 domain-containing protein [Rubrivivax sp. A210]